MQPKSKLIKNKIKSLKFNQKNKDYVKTLIELEDYILNGAKGYAHAVKMNSITSSYRKDYLVLLKELDPKEYKREIKEEKKEIREEKEFEKQEREEKKKENEFFRKLWKKHDGEL